MTVTEAVTLLSAVGAFIVSVAAAFVSVWTAIQARAIHTAVNSQATKFEALAKATGRAEGALEIERAGGSTTRPSNASERARRALSVDSS